MKSQIHTQLDEIARNYQLTIEARKNCEIEMKSYLNGKIDAYESCMLFLGFSISEMLAVKDEEL